MMYRWARYSVVPLDPNNKSQVEHLEEEGVRLSPRIKKLIYGESNTDND